MTEAEAYDALKSREPIFHRPELGTSRADFEQMVDDRFWEVGASGRVYDLGFVLDELEKRHASPQDETWEVDDFACRKLDERIFLVTYLLAQGRRKSRRSTLWRYEAGTWRAVYHQGTLLPQPG